MDHAGAYEFVDGKFLPIEDPFPEGGDDWKETVEAQGFTAHAAIEYEGYFAPYYIYSSDRKKTELATKYLFMVDVNPCDTVMSYVFVRSIPDFLGLLAQVQPLLAQRHFEETQEIGGAIRKLFRAYHGHYTSSICRECAPDEYEAQQRRRQERLKELQQRADLETCSCGGTFTVIRNALQCLRCNHRAS